MATCTLPDLLAAELPAELDGLAFRARPGDPPPAHTYWLGRPHYRLGGVDLPVRFEEANNTIACHRALVPGAGLLATADYLTRQTSGRDRVTGAYVALGRGFGLGWPLPHPYGWWASSRCFGHPGGFSCVAFADPDANIAVAMLTNGNRSMGDLVRRFAPLSSRLRAAFRAA